MTGLGGQDRLAQAAGSIPTIPFPAAAVEQSAAEIEAKFRWARKQGHIAYLWPDVPVHAWRSCLHEIERVTQLVMAGTRARVEWVSPPGTDARAAGIAAFTSGMGALLGYWIEAGRLQTPAELAALLRLHVEHGRRRSDRMRQALHAALDLLHAHDVRVLVVKSAHTAGEYFPEPGVRPAADIDLVISPTDVPVASAALQAAGYLRLKTQRRPYKSDWAPPGGSRVLRSIELTHAENPFSIELHDSINRSFFGVRTLRFDLAGMTTSAVAVHAAASVLVQPLLTLFLAAHASEEVHQLQLIRIVELALVLERDTANGRLDPAELLRLIRDTGSARFVYPAFELAERLVPGIVPEPVLAELHAAAKPRMRRVLESMSPATAQRLEGLSLDERFLWTSGPVDTIRRLLYMIWPTLGESRSLARVYFDRVARLVRGRVSLRRRR